MVLSNDVFIVELQRLDELNPAWDLHLRCTKDVYKRLHEILTKKYGIHSVSRQYNVPSIIMIQMHDDLRNKTRSGLAVDMNIFVYK